MHHYSNCLKGNAKLKVCSNPPHMNRFEALVEEKMVFL